MHLGEEHDTLRHVMDHAFLRHVLPHDVGTTHCTSNQIVTFCLSPRHPELCESFKSLVHFLVDRVDTTYIASPAHSSVECVTSATGTHLPAHLAAEMVTVSLTALG